MKINKKIFIGALGSAIIVNPLGLVAGAAIGAYNCFANKDKEKEGEKEKGEISSYSLGRYDKVLTSRKNESSFSSSPSRSCSVKYNTFLKNLAILSADVYGDLDIPLPHGCYLYNEYRTNSGLHAKLYRLSSGQYVCAFAGTDSLRDMVHNVAQWGGASSQYEEAVEFAKDVRSRYSSNVIFTGHSKGGGEAAYCAYSLGLKAYTFNPAGLSIPSTFKVSHNNWERAKVHSYIFGWDALNIFQDFVSTIHPLFNITADGEVHQVTDYHAGSLSISDFHGIKGILNYFGVYV